MIDLIDGIPFREVGRLAWGKEPYRHGLTGDVVVHECQRCLELVVRRELHVEAKHGGTLP